MWRDSGQPPCHLSKTGWWLGGDGGGQGHEIEPEEPETGDSVFVFSLRTHVTAAPQKFVVTSEACACTTLSLKDSQRSSDESRT